MRADAAVAEFTPVSIPPATINLSDEQIYSNISHSIKRQLPQLDVVKSSASRAILVAGGWSLPDYLEDIRDGVSRGWPVFAMNGSAKWLTDRGIRPNFFVLLDGRPDNVVFVEEALPGCTYLISSNCHPSIFDKLRGRQVVLYHNCPTDEGKTILDDYYLCKWHWVNCGCTVGLGAISVARAIGYPFLSLFGYDGCYSPDGSHHAYAQPLNDDEETVEVRLNGQTFRCSRWQLKQANNFHHLVIHYGKHFSLKIYGDGLISHVLQTQTLPEIQKGRTTKL